MNTINALMLLTTQTSLHAGAGQSISGIDLPIQREAHSQWPCVFGSAVKGALRAMAETGPLAQEADSVTDLFGPAVNAERNERDTAHAGALMVGDARILLLPVRSLQGIFRWVTCPAVLRRLKRDAARLGVDAGDWTPPDVAKESALVASGNGRLFLEEYRLERVESPVAAAIAETLAGLSPGALDGAELKERLTLVHDDIFTWLATHATAVNAHIAIDSETKSVRDGALWYEETLPPDTVLYASLAATASRRRGSELQPATVMALVSDRLLPPDRPWLQLGGNETTGMGWCHVSLCTGKA